MIKVMAVTLLGLAATACAPTYCACTGIPIVPSMPSHSQSFHPYPPSTQGTPPPQTTIDYTQNHQTFTLQKGSLVNVVLNSTYWNFANGMYNNVLQQIGSQTSPCPVGPNNFPGSGCGLVSREFRAANTGTTTVDASRTSCGEAMGCTGDQGSFSVTIVIY